ncbi:rna-directed dna polymerase from mobile element jockey-like [Limosa lapponica baueri]|uniref:Rna-directed dna polymerase from mobile element jockey-like n=1 Tax=Limosa lapponica baueri TaxID=1758121 RepID=A0A2I0ULM8_LIMLA|nr:rna-directed dna polymerase from mobile element jockey-like [Limosa lapponica baueri]
MGGKQAKSCLGSWVGDLLHLCKGQAALQLSGCQPSSYAFMCQAKYLFISTIIHATTENEQLQEKTEEKKYKGFAHLTLFPYKTLIDKLMMYELGKWTVGWTENCLNDRVQRLVINGTRSSWGQVTRGIPKGSMLGPILCDIFATDLDDGAECTLSKFEGDTGLGGVADTPDGCAAIQRHFEGMEIRIS